MLGLSGVIACSTPRPIRFRALVHLFSRTSFPGLVPDSRSGSLLRAYEDIERSSRSDSDLHTLQFGIVPVQGICSDDTDCRRPGHDLGQVLLPVTILVGCRTDEIVPSGPPGPGPRVPRANLRAAPLLRVRPPGQSCRPDPRQPAAPGSAPEVRPARGLENGLVRFDRQQVNISFERYYSRSAVDTRFVANAGGCPLFRTETA